MYSRENVVSESHASALESFADEKMIEIVALKEADATEDGVDGTQPSIPKETLLTANTTQDTRDRKDQKIKESLGDMIDIANLMTAQQRESDADRKVAEAERIKVLGTLTNAVAGLMDVVKHIINKLRIRKNTFDFLTAHLAPHLRRADTTFCKALPVEKHVCVALHRLASGSNLQVIGDMYSISTSTAQKIVIEFCDAISASGLHDLLIKWPSMERMQSLARDFEAIHGIPYVIGTVDGSHVPIIAPRAHQKDYFNRKVFHSIILQMTVAANCVVWDYDIGWTGSMNDWNVFQRNQLGQRCASSALSKYCLLGDCAYLARVWMLPPFKGSKDGLSPQEYFWNYIQSSSRMPVERAFGTLKARFRILLKRCDMLLQNVPK
ncbi:hypothetical protein L7F22_029865 [Adiantum nelumboides]|nr:hypothetical protein [Adiantum nelumboides]